MSTRCLIGKQNKDKSITYVYCHNDGYPSWAGKTLLHHYTDETKLDKLLALGDMSSLGTEPIAKEYNYEDPKEERERYCEPYSLRGEDCPAKTATSQSAFLKVDAWEKYWYLFKEGQWYVSTTGRQFNKLTENMLKRD